ncbi:HAD family hydrolase [bacterium]|nr:HAD family hydrolase [bacterium]
MINLKTKEWEIKNIETVLFDKDGTFIDLHFFWGKITRLRALEIIKRNKLEDFYFEQLCNFLGYDLKNAKMLNEGITALYSRVKIIEIFQKNLEEIGINVSIKELEEIFDDVSKNFYKNIDKYIKPISEAVDFIKQLRKLNLKTGIVTSDSVESTNLTLKINNWENLFDIVIGRESSSETKESGIPTKLALQKLEANPITTIMIGDSPTDYLSAKNAGIEKTILVSTGQVNKNELKKYSNYVVESMEEVECLKI